MGSWIRKRILGTDNQIRIKHGLYIIRMYQYWFISCEEYTIIMLTIRKTECGVYATVIYFQLFFKSETILKYFLSINYLFLFFFLFGCIGSSLLHAGFLQLWRAGATLHCSVWASHCGVQALGVQASLVVACGLQSAGSVVVVHGLSCSAACGIFPDQGSNSCPLHWQVDS